MVLGECDKHEGVRTIERSIKYAPKFDAVYV